MSDLRGETLLPACLPQGLRSKYRAGQGRPLMLQRLMLQELMLQPLMLQPLVLQCVVLPPPASSHSSSSSSTPPPYFPAGQVVGQGSRYQLHPPPYFPPGQVLGQGSRDQLRCERHIQLMVPDAGGERGRGGGDSGAGKRRGGKRGRAMVMSGDWLWAGGHVW